MLGNLGIDPECGDWGWRKVYGKSMMGMELPETRLTLLLRSTPNPGQKCGFVATSFNIQTHTIFLWVSLEDFDYVFIHTSILFFIYLFINKHSQKKVGKITRPFRYDLNQIPYHYTVEVTNISCIDRVSKNYEWRFVTLYRRQ